MEKKIELPEITLLGVDCCDINRLILAAKHSQKNIEFGEVSLLTSLKSADPSVKQIKHIGSIKAYSKFIVEESSNYFKTEHALIIQHDGFVLNAGAWTDDFLKYDYIGAPWPNRRVGNGGFSLRSKKLMGTAAAG